jgi:hypothetical protein
VRRIFIVIADRKMAKRAVTPIPSPIKASRPSERLPDERERIDATWGVYSFALSRNPEYLPKLLRPAPVGRALATWTDAVLAARAVPDAERMRILAGGLDAFLLLNGLRSPDGRLMQASGTIDDRLDDLGAALRLPKPLVSPDRTTATYDPLTQASTICSTLTLDLAVPFDDLPALLDPQAWATSSDCFKQSYRVRCDDYAKRPQTTLGKAWSGCLFERFQLPNASFDNILRIKFTADAKTIRCRYQLVDSVGFRFIGFPSAPVVEVNEGHLIVQRLGDYRAQFDMTKTVVFADLTPNDSGPYIDSGMWLNYTAPAMLCLWAREASKSRLVAKPPAETNNPTKGRRR